jgi:capsular exopolysaccharide synthesis family protein
MFTSALKDEGKSTTVANVAVALARAGNHIALVDLDLRRPRIHELFGLDSDRGVTRVAMYKLELEDALQPVSLVSPNAATPPATAANPRLGVLDVLACGPRPPDVGDFLAQPRLNTLLRSLPRLYDLTLIDAPPMLGVSDAVAVGSKVDAIVVVSRVRELTQGALRDLAAALRASPASKLGLVITAAELDVDHRENYYRGYYASTRHTNHREEEWPPA